MAQITTPVTVVGTAVTALVEHNYQQLAVQVQGTEIQQATQQQQAVVQVSSEELAYTIGVPQLQQITVLHGEPVHRAAELTTAEPAQPAKLEYA
jgi:hypothetical protein